MTINPKEISLDELRVYALLSYDLPRTRKQLREKLHMTDGRVRDLIRCLRNRDIPIVNVGKGKGYKLGRSDELLSNIKYIDSYIKSLVDLKQHMVNAWRCEYKKEEGMNYEG